jgi:hypothetical protein
MSIDDIQFDELPDWLQGMAPATPAQPQSAPQPPIASDQPTPDDLPEWLREPSSGESSWASIPQPAPSTETSAERQGIDHQPADEFSLVSDEDLPDWLKALSDEDDDTTSASPSFAAPASPAGRTGSAPTTTAVANLFEVPPISRAWMTQGRAIDQDEVSAARQEFLPLDSVSSLVTEQADTASIWDSGPIETSESDQETQPFTIPQVESYADRSGCNPGAAYYRRVAYRVCTAAGTLMTGTWDFENEGKSPVH